MSAAVRQRQSRSVKSQGKASRVADYIKEEFPVPRGQPTGLMLRKDDRKLAAIILSIAQALWFITISIGIIYYSGTLRLFAAVGWLAQLHKHMYFLTALICARQIAIPML